MEEEEEEDEEDEEDEEEEEEVAEQEEKQEEVYGASAGRAPARPSGLVGRTLGARCANEAQDSPAPPIQCSPKRLWGNTC